MTQGTDSQIGERAKGHLEAFLGTVVIPIPALLVLGQAILTGGDEIDVFGLKLSVQVASLLVGITVAFLFLIAARSLRALSLLITDANLAEVREALQTHPSALNPFFLGAATSRIEGMFINNLASFMLGVLIGAAVFTDLFTFGQEIFFWDISWRSYFDNPAETVVMGFKFFALWLLVETFILIGGKLERRGLGENVYYGVLAAVGAVTAAKVIVRWPDSVAAFATS